MKLDLSKFGSLQQAMDSMGNLTEYFYNDTLSPHAIGRATLSPVPLEVTNWRDEQHGWKDSAILLDQSHHMPELFLTGPDARKLLEFIGPHSFAGFGPGKAKTYLACNFNGQVIGESVLHCHGENNFELISGMPLLNWVHFHAETGDYDVKVVRDNQTSGNPKGVEGRTNFRYQLAGPNAEAIFQEVVEGTAPEIPFFRTAYVHIAGRKVFVLRHGMAGHKGVEISGPYKDGPDVRAALIATGAKYEMLLGGAKTYWSTGLESGWIAYPVPAIYTDERLRKFREWLPGDTWEAYTQIGGSFVSSNIEDHYVTPWDLGLQRLIKFDHEFIGREALERLSTQPHRTKVTLAWNKDDVAKIFRSLFEPGTPYKYLEFPVSSYAFQQADEVRTLQGELVGLYKYCGYSGNEAEMLSLAFVKSEYATPGTEVVVTWGEPNGGSRKPHVEKHRQVKVRAIVGPAPYAKAVRQHKQVGSGTHVIG